MKTELKSVVVGKYVNDEGNGVVDVYTTVDDSFLVVRVSVFNELFSLAEARRTSPAEMSFEEAENEYGDQIIDKFLDANGMLDEYGERCLTPKVIDGRKENQKKATKANVEKGKLNQAIIIKAILKGMSKLEIESSIGFTRPTINKAVNALTQQEFEEIWKKYRETVFADMDGEITKRFIYYGCNHKKWLAHLARQRDLASRNNEAEVVTTQEDTGSDDIASVESLIAMFGCEEA